MKSEIKILMIDDDKDDFLIIKDLLSEKKIKYSLDYCSTYEDGLKNISSLSHDIYFLDYGLEGKTGIDLIKQIKKTIKQLPIIIMLTGFPFIDENFNLMEEGISDYLIKDEINLDLLERTIRHCLERRKLQNNLINEKNILDTLFQTINTGICVVNDEGVVNRFNNSFKEILGLECKDIIKRKIEDIIVFKKIIYKKDTCELFNISYEDIKIEAKTPIECKIKSSSEKENIVLISCRQFVYVNGLNKIFNVLTVTDINDQKEIEEGLRKANKEMKKHLKDYGIEKSNPKAIVDLIKCELDNF